MRMRGSRNRRNAFTLVEMLVAVALVLLLMSLFAQVFQMAGGSMSTQRGIMENDQRARTVETLVLNDLHKRSTRKLVPFTLNEDPNAAEADLFKRRGYFYYSENDPANDWDDVLAFTVDAGITLYSTDKGEYYGQTVPLVPTNLPGSMTPNQWMTSLYTSGGSTRRIDNRNQPEIDDSRLDFNLTGSSPGAEIVYFVRNGNLYRRVLLLRQPGESLPGLEQPTDWNGDRFFTRAYHPTSKPLGSSAPENYPVGFQNAGMIRKAQNFWNDFDYSAHPQISGASGSEFYDGAYFNGFTCLEMDESVSATTNAWQIGMIGFPPNRFGHNYGVVSPAIPTFLAGGQPREFGTGGFYVGRLTLEETSRSVFNYPHLTHNMPPGVTDNSNPMNSAVAWTDTNSDFIVEAAGTDLQAGPRRGEDLLLGSVLAFDVKIWDDAAQQFVNLGELGEDLDNDGTLDAGEDLNNNGIFDRPIDFAVVNRLNGIYGPHSAVSAVAPRGNLVFDTWHPFGRVDYNANNTADPNESQPPFRPRKFQPNNASAYGNTPTLDIWAIGGSYGVGDRVFPPAIPGLAQDSFYYVCVNANDINSDGDYDTVATGNPPWARIAGLNTEDNELTWQAVYNLKPVRAIQITLRFQDRNTGQIRTQTIQHALID